jgi:hypothetical protein
VPVLHIPTENFFCWPVPQKIHYFLLERNYHFAFVCCVRFSATIGKAMN